MKKLTVLAGSLLIALGASGAAGAQSVGSNVSPTAEVEEPRSLAPRTGGSGADAADGSSDSVPLPPGGVTLPPSPGVTLPIIGGGDEGGEGDEDEEDVPRPGQLPPEGIDLDPGEELVLQEPWSGGIFTVVTSALGGDLTLYVSLGREPTTTNYDWKSARPGTNETVIIRDAQPGTYFIRVVAERATRGARVRINP